MNGFYLLVNMGLYIYDAFGLRSVFIQYVAGSLFLAFVATAINRIFASR